MLTALYETSQYLTEKVLAVQVWIRWTAGTINHFAFFNPYPLTPSSKGQIAFNIII